MVLKRLVRRLNELFNLKRNGEDMSNETLSSLQPLRDMSPSLSSTPAVELQVLQVGDRVRIARKVLNRDAVVSGNLTMGMPSTHPEPAAPFYSPSREPGVGMLLCHPHPWSHQLVGSWITGMDWTLGRRVGCYVELKTGSAPAGTLLSERTPTYKSAWRCLTGPRVTGGIQGLLSNTFQLKGLTS